MVDPSEQVYELKLVPLDDPNADGTWKNKMLINKPNFDDEHDGCFVVAIRGPITIGPQTSPQTCLGIEAGGACD